MHVISCGKSLPKMKKSLLHSHPNWEIVMTCAGTARADVGGKIFEVKKGDITVIPPHVGHSLESGDYFEDIYVIMENTDFSHIGVFGDNDGSVFAMMNTLLRIMTEKGTGYKMAADALGGAICKYINYLDSQRSGYMFLNVLKNVMYDNISNPDFLLGKAIENTGYNPDYVRRMFKKEFGITPLEHLTNLRITSAKVLLTDVSFVSVADVAYRCGFFDPLYFSTCFKKHEGMSPVQYRKKETLMQ